MKKTLKYHVISLLSLVFLISACAEMRIAGGTDDGSSGLLDPPEIAIVNVTEISGSGKAAKTETYTLLEITPVQVAEGIEIYYSMTGGSCTDPIEKYDGAVVIDLKATLAEDSSASGDISKANINSAPVPEYVSKVMSVCIQAKVVKDGIASSLAILKYKVESIEEVSTATACLTPYLSLNGGATAVACGDTVSLGTTVSINLSHTKLDTCDQLYIAVDGPSGFNSATYDAAKPYSPWSYSDAGYYVIDVASKDSKGVATEAKLNCSFTIR